MSFENLGLAEELMRAVRNEGYETATPIQDKAIPGVLDGRDLMGCAQTGTGKTAAFALPTLHRLMSCAQPAPQPQRRANRNGHSRPIRALVLAPTRELAVQIGESFSAYGRFTKLRTAVIYGGVGYGSQIRALQSGVDILVATPGRLLDLMKQGYVDLHDVEVLVLDEADQMLDMGFIHDLRRIVAAVPKQRQTLMFSATMPPEIRKLASEWLRDPAHVQVAPAATPVELVSQSVYFVEPRHKPQLLTHFLQNTAYTRTLVFARTKHGADKIAKMLDRAGIKAAAIHGNKSQNARSRVLQQFKSNRPPVLVATDVAARGLDVDGVSHVINYELPEVPEIYVHRIGRTGRAGAEGIATSFCGRDERDRLRAIERLMRRRIDIEPALDLPEVDAPAPAREPHQRAAPADSSHRRPRKKPRPRQAMKGSSTPTTNGDSRGGRPAKRKRRKFFSKSKGPRQPAAAR